MKISYKPYNFKVIHSLHSLEKTSFKYECMDLKPNSIDVFQNNIRHSNVENKSLSIDPFWNLYQPGVREEVTLETQKYLSGHIMLDRQ